MPQYGYVVVEGPHDVEFVYRLLSVFGFARIRSFDDLDRYWQSLVPRAFPHQGDLQKRVPVPLFLANSTHSVALQSAIGISRIVETIEETMVILPANSLAAVGIVLDADDLRVPAERVRLITDDLGHVGLQFAPQPGIVNASIPSTGVFVMPDNVNAGTLEAVLIECGKVQYGQLLAEAQGFVSRVDRARLTNEDLEEFQKPAGQSKAVINAMASILKPGKAIQTSIQDNRWLRDAGLAVPTVVAVSSFLRQLLSLP